MELMLHERTQSAVHRLLCVEPERGALLGAVAMEALTDLVASDAFGVVEADKTGRCLRATTLPEGELEDPQLCDGPLPAGLVHDAALTPDRRAAADSGLCDILQLGFVTASGSVVQLYFDRRARTFEQADVEVLRMVTPAIRRLVRGSESSTIMTCLTRSEREVLSLVSRGASNREVAEELFVTVHTVRKHLENAYRKLGVNNRTAAALRLRAGS